MSTRLLNYGAVRLVINQSVVPVDLEPSPEECRVFPLSTISGCILYTNMLYIKHCLLILPLFVAIYVI